jgi:tellurite methyltransferase
MSHPDADRWNQRYQQELYHPLINVRPLLLENAFLLPACGLAFEAAMGLGGNAGFLLERGLHVIGVDVSEVAVRQAKKRLPDLMAAIADLTCFYLPPNTFDVILNFYYLQRELWPVYKKALHPGGLIFIETLTLEMLRIHPEIDPAYLLEPGELREGFADLHILVYREGWEANKNGHQRAVAGLVARLVDKNQGT